MVKMPPIQNRKELRGILSSVLKKNGGEEDDLDFRKKLKTYVIESNIPEVTTSSVKGIFQIEDTEDSSLKILKANLSPKNSLRFYLDVSDKRFWKLHSLYDSIATEDAIKKMVEQNYSKLDFLWFSSNLLEKYMEFGKQTGFGLKFKNKFSKNGASEDIKDVSMRFWGGGAKDIIGDLRGNERLVKGISLSAIGINHSVEGGFTKENITNSGKFTVMTGNSIDSHFGIVEKIKQDYSDKIRRIEEQRISVEKKSAGLKFKGSSLFIDFDKPLEDVHRFTNKLISATNPFRLAGTKQFLDGEHSRVFALDLHSNDLLNLEITPNWMSIALGHKSCGNVVMRLLTNIQTHLTSQVKLMSAENERII
jgi:hypothetical protein